MEATLASFRKRLSEPWIVGVEPADALSHFDQAVDVLRDKPGTVVVALSDDSAFLMHALAAIALQRPCLLATESWPAEMIKRVAMPVDTVFGNILWLNHDRDTGAQVPSGALLIATGGSGGQLRFAIHSWGGLCAAVAGYRQFWDAACLDVVNVLPLYHVGGFVPALRSFITGGELILANWKHVEAGALSKLPLTRAHISLVPTQLMRLLKSEAGCEWLRSMGAVLVGGGSASQSILMVAVKRGVPVVPAYGMTEALGTVALARDCNASMVSTAGTVLPHWRVQIVDGEIQIAGAALFQGYLPEDESKHQASPASGWYATGDLGTMDKDGQVRVLGRKDRLIVTGGEKVNPVLVEEALRASGLCHDVVVFGVEDAEWGQRVVAVLAGERVADDALYDALCDRLPAYAIPKSYRFVDKLPRNELGKMSREFTIR